MRLIWGTRTRGGSQFLLKLTVAMLGRRTQPQSRINAARHEQLMPVRSPTLEDYVARGRPLDYFRDHNISALKLEEPGADDWGRKIADAFPEAPWLGNRRSIEKIYRSHHNLSWGFSEEKLLKRARRTLVFYEALAAQGRLFVLDVEGPDQFDLQKFSHFLKVGITAEARKIVEDWAPVNDLANIRAAAGKPLERVFEPPALDTLHRRYPWVPDMEARYNALCQNLNI
ncbi:MAG: hypothetical protein ABI056_04115 [Caulobacteraceae bacterium]